MIRRLRDRAAAAAVLGGYLVLTLAFTYPLLLNFARAIPGDGFDGWQNYWNLWWVKIALLEQHTSPFFTDLLYYPTGVGLLFHTLNPFNGLLTLPVQLAAGLFPAYNGAVLFSFAVGGLGVYLLARHVLGLGSSRLVAFAAGIIFSFSPYHIAHLLGHMQLISLEWIPFYVLYLLRAVNGAERNTQKANLQPATRNLRDILLAAFFLVLVALCDWYYVFYCLIFTAVVAIWAAWQTLMAGRTAPLPSRLLSPLLRTLVVSAAICLVWAVAISPLLAPMVREARQSNFMVPDPRESRLFSADLLAFFTPQQFHPLWGGLAATKAKVFMATVAEYQVFAGFTVLALALLGIFVILRRTAPAAKGTIPRQVQPVIRSGLWLLTLIVFFLLALGPVLHIAGRTALLPGGREIPLPYAWLVHVVPFMNITRSVSRFDVMVMLALAILAALGLHWLARRGRAGRVATIAAMALIVFEFLPIPYPMCFPDTPAWYKTLAADPRPGSVMILPMEWDRPNYLLDQTTHGKPMVAGYISREDPRMLVERAPVFHPFRHLGADIIAFDPTTLGKQALNDLGVRWVVLDRYQMPENPNNPKNSTRSITTGAAAQIFGQQSPLYQDDRLIVYEVPTEALTAPYLILDTNWGLFDLKRQTRTFTGNASVIVRTPSAGQMALRIMLAPSSAPLDLPLEGDAYVIRTAVHPGANPIMLRASRPSDRVEVMSLALEP